jgi:uncharacterized protein
MKIDVRRIPAEGITLVEEFSPKALDLDTEMVRFLEPVKVMADISKSYDAVKVSLAFSSVFSISCSRCLKEAKRDFSGKAELDYAADKENPVIELDPQVREEIILGYSMKPLCKIDCKGLCPECGADLNEGGCNCGTT